MKRRLVVVVSALVLGLVVPSPAHGASSTAGDATPNFTESGTCGVYGMRGPLSPTNTLGDRIYGPFADYFGRSRSQVSSAIVDWVEPSGHETSRTMRPSAIDPRGIRKSK